jgi:hypothetical protein
MPTPTLTQHPGWLTRRVIGHRSRQAAQGPWCLGAPSTDVHFVQIPLPLSGETRGRRPPQEAQPLFRRAGGRGSCCVLACGWSNGTDTARAQQHTTSSAISITHNHYNIPTHTCARTQCKRQQSKIIRIPAHAAGSIIGRAGSVINQLKEDSGCQIQMSQQVGVGGFARGSRCGLL